MRLASVTTRLQLVFIPGLVILASALLYLFTQTATSFYNERFKATLAREISYAKFIFSNTAQDLMHEAEGLANVRAVGESLSDQDPGGAASVLAEQLPIKDIDLGFVLTTNPSGVEEWPQPVDVVRGHNTLLQGTAGERPLITRVWPQLRQALVRGDGTSASVVFSVTQKDLEDELGAVLPEPRRAATLRDDAFMFAASPVRSFQRVVGYVILGRSLTRNPTLADRLQQAIENTATKSETIVLLQEQRTLLSVGNLKLRPDLFRGLLARDNEFLRLKNQPDEEITAFFVPLEDSGEMQLGVLSDHRDLRSTLSSLTKTTLVMVSLITLPILLILGFAVRHLLRPLQSLKTASDAIIAGDYSARAMVSSADEIGTVATRFNQMAESIERHMQRLADLVTQGRYIASQISLHGVLRSAKTALNRLVQEKVTVEILFSEACFTNHRLTGGFYPIDELGKPIEAARESYDGLRRREGQLLIVRDPRSSIPLAALIVVHPDPAISREVLQTLEPATNHIASAITTVRLEKALEELQKITRQMRTILTNINQGILIVDHQLRIQPEHSEHSKAIFGRDDLTGKNLIDLLLASSDLPLERRGEIESCLASSFDLDVLTYQLNSGFLPRELTLLRNERPRQYEVDWIPLVNHHDYVTHIMVTLRDVTDLHALRSKEALLESEMMVVREIAATPQEDFDAAVEAIGHHLASCRALLEGGDDTAEERIRRIRQCVHSIRVDATAVGIHTLKARALQTENRLSEVLDLQRLRDPNLGRQVNHLVGEITEVVERYARIGGERMTRVSAAQRHRSHAVRHALETSRALLQSHALDHEAHGRLLHMHQILTELEYATLNSLARKIETAFGMLAADLGRQPLLVQLASGEDWALSDRAGHTVHCVLMQLAHNSFEHAFRDPGAEARIVIRTNGAPTVPEIVYQDNGPGLAFSNGTELTAEAEIAALAFDPACPQAAGLDGALRMMQEIGGGLTVEFLTPSREGTRRPFRVRLAIPSIDILDRI